MAGKTGTSEEESDAWFVGYTPEYSTAVWVGHPRTREYTGFGGPTAGPIWKDYMEAATAGKCPAFEVPSSLPELSALTGGHTASGSEYSGHFGEEEEFEEEEIEGGFEAGEEKKPKKKAWKPKKGWKPKKPPRRRSPGRRNRPAARRRRRGRRVAGARS